MPIIFIFEVSLEIFDNFFYKKKKKKEKKERIETITSNAEKENAYDV